MPTGAAVPDAQLRWPQSRDWPEALGRHRRQRGFTDGPEFPFGKYIVTSREPLLHGTTAGTVEVTLGTVTRAEPHALSRPSEGDLRCECRRSPDRYL